MKETEREKREHSHCIGKTSPRKRKLPANDFLGLERYDNIYIFYRYLKGRAHFCRFLTYSILRSIISYFVSYVTVFGCRN